MSEKFCERPWGTWEIIDQGPWYKVKRLIVEPNKSISLQYHIHRSETWAITQGRGEVRLDGDTFQVKQGDGLLQCSGAGIQAGVEGEGTEQIFGPGGAAGKGNSSCKNDASEHG